ncbi:MAG: YHS domain-containing (seleno)protein [Wenzhouxiangella sp.]
MKQDSTRIGLFAVAMFLTSSMLTLAWAEGTEPPLALEGYSPVSYFDPGMPEKGSAEFSAVHNNREYHFTSAQQLASFEADPERFEPLFPDHCPYNLALGRAAAIDPENFKIADGHLLLFHHSEEMDAREQWEKHENESELLERARGMYTLFRF